MKRLILLITSALLAISFTLPAQALWISFTHPELGETLSIQMEDGLISFQIYGFTYYEIVSPLTPFRGMIVNQSPLIHDLMPTLEESLYCIFDSNEEKKGDQKSLTISYTGVAEHYSQKIDKLNRSQKVEAIKLLNGFEGFDGYNRLLSITGFEDEDLSVLSEDYNDFFAWVNGKRYEYRVLRFRFEGEGVDDYHYEQYCYLKVNGIWRLSRVTKEYGDMSRYRQSYQHGISGSWLVSADNVHHELMQDLYWGMPTEEIAYQFGIVKNSEQMIIPETDIFRIPCTITFITKDGQLTEIKYSLKNELSFYAAFISLYMRYADPVTVDEDGSISWSLNDCLIQLIYDKINPVICVLYEEW